MDVMILTHDVIIRKAVKNDLDEMVDFAFKMNNQKETSSSFCSKNETYIRKDLLDSIRNKKVIGAWIFDDLVGMISTYIDKEKHNIDCFIFIDSNQCDYDEVAKLLMDEMTQDVSDDYRYTFFFSKENKECSNFLTTMHAVKKTNEYGMIFLRQQATHVQKSDQMMVLPEIFYQDFVELHDTTFSEIYISGKEIMADLGKNRHVFSLIEDDQIKAYSVLFLHGNKRATAEVIAVNEHYLHQGYGRTALAHLLHVAIHELGMEMVDLIVDSDNSYALKLYLDIGFTIEFENHSYQLPSKRKSD
jgi:ribosomal protein S18 acetylase RimI-like enzyme